jgi:hypothetical protein
MLVRSESFPDQETHNARVSGVCSCVLRVLTEKSRTEESENPQHGYRGEMCSFNICGGYENDSCAELGPAWDPMKEAARSDVRTVF